MNMLTIICFICALICLCVYINFNNIVIELYKWKLKREVKKSKIATGVELYEIKDKNNTLIVAVVMMNPTYASPVLNPEWDYKDVYKSMEDFENKAKELWGKSELMIDSYKNKITLILTFADLSTARLTSSKKY